MTARSQQPTDAWPSRPGRRPRVPLKQTLGASEGAIIRHRPSTPARISLNYGVLQNM